MQYEFAISIERTHAGKRVLDLPMLELHQSISGAVSSSEKIFLLQRDKHALFRRRAYDFFDVTFSSKS